MPESKHYVKLSLLTNLYISETLRVTYGTPCRASSHCFLVLPILLVWHYTTQWSSDKAPVLLTGHYVTSDHQVIYLECSDLRERFSLSDVSCLVLLPVFERFFPV